MDGFLKKRQFFKRGFQENYLFCEKKESNIQKNTKQCKKVTVKNIIVGNNFGKTSGERELDRRGGEVGNVKIRPTRTYTPCGPTTGLLCIIGLICGLFMEEKGCHGGT